MVTFATRLGALGAGLQGKSSEFRKERRLGRQEKAKLSVERRQALFDDMVIANDLANVKNDVAGAAQFLDGRVKEINRLGGDATDTLALQKGLSSTDPEEQAAAKQSISGIIDRANVLKASKTPGASALDVARTGKLEAETAQIGQPATPSALDAARTAKVRAETQQIGKPKPERPITAKERAETAKIVAETKKLNRLAGGETLTKAEEKELDETVKANVKRISTLSQASASRAAAVKTASKFLRAFKKGEATSGAGRTTLSFIPGVFTSQGQFDEELDSFAEVAAREKLKAVGEIRPTDADVTGMKRALFGLGRDEKTNINLLEQFISEQEALDDELDALRTSKDTGGLASFTGLQNAPIEVDF